MACQFSRAQIFCYNFDVINKARFRNLRLRYFHTNMLGYAVKSELK